MSSALLLGIDTGGTFTDAVLIDETTEVVVAKAKAPTTHANLVVGVQAAMAEVLAAAAIHLDHEARVGLVSVSTTLATNALVEGTGDPACLFTMGFSDDELARAGIGDVSANCPLRSLPGGHDAHGNPLSDIDYEALKSAVDEVGDSVSAFAVAAQFSVRNPRHERDVSEFIFDATAKPVTCSYELSPRLGGPRRALTALLNARLIPMIVGLIEAARTAMTGLGIDAPLMIVRGDGTLAAADFAARRPIETVLSGPAASVIGARHLVEIETGLVADIGGTTTDVAIVRDGLPTTTTDGALVAGHRTMVEAIDMVTEGIGGDSEVRIDSRRGDGPIVVGPRRAIPLCRLAVDYPDLVNQTLERQLGSAPEQASDARFVVPLHEQHPEFGLDDRERSIVDRMAGQPIALRKVSSSGLLLNALGRLRERGLVRIAAFTPTDALQVAGHGASEFTTAVDRYTAEAAALVLARQTRSNGQPVAASALDLAQKVIAVLEQDSSQVLLRAALAADGLGAPELAESALVQAALGPHRGLLNIDLALGAPLIAIGAPAAAFYPNVAATLGTTVSIPDHADVANAIGSVVGRVKLKAQATVSQPTKGQFRLHLEEQQNFGSAERARDVGLALLSAQVLETAEHAGASDPELTHTWTVTTATVEGKEVFVEGLLVATATGRARFQSPS